VSASCLTNSFFLGIEADPDITTIDAGADWEISFGNIRQKMNPDEACWEADDVELLYYDWDLNAGAGDYVLVDLEA